MPTPHGLVLIFKGIIFDGIQPNTLLEDLDYVGDASTVSVRFSGFESTLHGISSFAWAVGTEPSLEDIQPFTELGISVVEETNNDGTGK